MKTRRELAQVQLDIMNQIRKSSDINMVTCGNCGTILLHYMNEYSIVCFECMNDMDLSDCPDYWYNGCIENKEFNND